MRGYANMFFQLLQVTDTKVYKVIDTCRVARSYL